MKTGNKTKLLILEHEPGDVDLLVYELDKGGLDYIAEIVTTRESFIKALSGFRPDIILSDYSLPSFDGVSAYLITQQVCPNTPFIIVSGTVGEENAVELIKRGVTDYILKDKLFTVIPKINRALKEAAEREEKDRVQRQLEQARKEHQRELVRASIESQERERAHLGRELHDNINQILAVTRAYVDTALHENIKRDDFLVRSLQSLDLAINEIRKISKSLVPPSMNKDGLVDSVSDLVENMRAVNRFAIHFHCEKEELANLDDDRELALYRIVQEQINNIIKHSGASSVSIELTGNEGHVDLSIRDNGNGFDPGVRRNGVGLNNILSRIEVFDGRLEVISAPGEGCTLNVQMPKSGQTAGHFF